MDNRDVKIVMGMTSEELTEAAKGKQAIPIRCYVCKRREGDAGVELSRNDHEDSRCIPLRFDHLDVHIEEDLYFRYWLCHECVIILGALAGIDKKSNGLVSVSERKN